MNKHFVLQIVGLAAATCFLLCEPQPVPQEAFDKAYAAIEAAKKGGGEIYGPTQLKSGLAFYEKAQKDLSIEKKKLPFMRNYRSIIQSLDNATMAGEYSLAAVESAKDRIIRDSKALLSLSQSLADSLDLIIKTAATKKKNVVLFQRALDSAKMAQQEALALLTDGDLFLAEKKAIAASNKTTETAQSITKFLLTP